MKLLLAAIVPDPNAADPLAGLVENAPPVEVPWPWWVGWAIGAAALLLVALGAWVAARLTRRKLAQQPPSPRFLALEALQTLRITGASLDAYAFGVAVSDILRTYIARQYGLQTTQQTSPEFLASIASSARFTDSERRLLAAFLEQTDLRKYAHQPAGENDALLESAGAFVEGASA